LPAQHPFFQIEIASMICWMVIAPSFHLSISTVRPADVIDTQISTQSASVAQHVPEQASPETRLLQVIELGQQ